MNNVSSNSAIVYKWIKSLALATGRRIIKIPGYRRGKYGRFLRLLSSYQPVFVVSTTPLECSWKGAPLG